MMQCFWSITLLILASSSGLAAGPVYVSDQNVGKIWRLEDLNSDGDALDVDEQTLWSDGFTNVAELEIDGSVVYAIDHGNTLGSNQIVQLTDLNLDGDALDFGEKLIWAEGMNEPQGISRGLGADWFVTEFIDDQVWRFRDTNLDGDVMDDGEKHLFAINIDGARSVLARSGDVLVTASSGNQVHRLVDLNEDGDALDASENQVITPTINDVRGLITDGKGGVYFASQSSNTVYRGSDFNQDGDVLDLAETLSYADDVFGAINGPWGMTSFSKGQILLADQLDGQVLLVTDITGDDDALDLGEVKVWADGIGAPVDLVFEAGPVGDLDLDGDIDNDDLIHFCGVFGLTGTPVEFDLDDDGAVAISDLEFLLLQLGTLRGDLSGPDGIGLLDGTVDILDFGILSGNFGKIVSATYLDGNLNKDHVIDIEDFAILAGNFGQLISKPTTPTPEPATASLLTIGLVLLLRANRSMSPYQLNWVPSHLLRRTRP